MDKSTEIKQYFALWKEPFPIAAAHDHWVRWGKLLRGVAAEYRRGTYECRSNRRFSPRIKKWTSLVSRPFCFTIRFAPHGASELKL